MRDRGVAALMLAVFLAADGAAWFQVLAAGPPRENYMVFLDVGQGDSSFLELSDGVRVITDAGPGSSITKSLERALPEGGRYIDLAIITHPELDHFNGFNYLLEDYEFGAFIINGRDHPGSRQWAELLQKISAKKIPLITVGAGDAIRHGPSRIDILSPDAQLVSSSELNDGGIVEKVRTPDFTALLAADIGLNVEEYLRKRYDLSSDILKVGHHGSKYSSGGTFLRAAHPSVAVISSGGRNAYGHPAPDALARLSAAGIPVFRTDQRGNVTVKRIKGELKVFVDK